MMSELSNPFFMKSNALPGFVCTSALYLISVAIYDNTHDDFLNNVERVEMKLLIHVNDLF